MSDRDPGQEEIDRLRRQVAQLVPFHQAVEQNALGIVVTDIAGKIEYVNPRQLAATGYGIDELIGQSARIFQSGETPPQTYAVMWEAILAGRTWHGEMLNRRKNGELCWEFMHISPIRGASGEIERFFCIKEESISQHLNGTPANDPGPFEEIIGLPNRGQLIDKIARAISGRKARQSGLMLAYVDLDNFKAVNANLGQIGADQALLEVANRLRMVVRHSDEVIAVGGDEFVILFGESIDQAVHAETAERLLAAVRKPMRFDENEVVVTASIGISSYPLDGRDAQDLLSNADAAMFSAKSSGGDTYHFYEPEMNAGATARHDLTNQLRHVVDRDELILHYQPQVSLFSGEIVGVEALVRWRHPDKGMVPPNDFIPIAEETGLIVPIDEWVLRTAVQQAKAWQAEGLPALRMAVNLSARHFRYSNLPDTVAGVLDQYGLEPRYLELELTESAMMHDATQAVRIVDRLKSIGVHLSLDDFGTGYSSLAYLSRFAIDQLKIDQSFIRDITANPINASIATATIAMAHKLNKKVIAEGVETEAQMTFLRRHDCDEMQGFFFSRPCPAEEIAAMLRQGRRQRFDEGGNKDGQLTLLLIDDEQNILNSLKRLFRRENFRVLTANSGREALELLAVNEVQVIISDQRMPEMSGVELLSRVKELYPDTVRIVLSGYSELSTVTEAINRGAIWKYLSKPWDDDKLRDEVRRAFREARGAVEGNSD
jgi:diguanylate cyclase (GGDEF)-like protein/PAS domain S-box-containing protein